MRCKRSGLAGVIILAALGLSSASAESIYFTANGTGTMVYAPWNLTGGIFGFVYEYLDITVSCPGGLCVAASNPAGAPLGDYGFAIGGNYYLSNVGNGEPATLAGTSLYYQLLVPFGGGTGSVSMLNINDGYLLQGQVTGLGIYTTVTTNTATVEVDITNASSQVISGLPSTLYLDITGTTNAPTSLEPFTGNPSGNIISPFDLDWTATLSGTSFLNSSPSSTAPEPSGGAIFGIGVLCLLAARRLVRIKTGI
jgi:hypothetical protein